MPLKRQYRPKTLEIGLDEAGRGCLAGPVTAAAVVLMPRKPSPKILTDSKKLSAKQRDELRIWIENNSLAWAVGWCSPEEIDKENILQASMSAMHKAIKQVLKQLESYQSSPAILTKIPDDFLTRPQLLLVDGHYFRPYGKLDHSCQKKGDGRFQSIAAASILAKTHRDEYMLNLHEQYPAYGWNSNMGYPTPPHQKALGEVGPSPWHRKTFRLSY